MIGNSSLLRSSWKLWSTVMLVMGLTLVIALTVFLATEKKSKDIRSKAVNLSNTLSSASSNTDVVTQNLIIPGIQGFQSDSFTGDAGVSYSISLPDGTGGLSPSVGLTYSSSFVTDYGTGLGKGRVKPYEFSYQTGIVGLGWELTGIGSVSKNREEDTGETKYMLNLGGVSYKLVPTGDETAPDGTRYSLWKTSPEGFLKIKHKLCNGNQAQDTGPWEVLDKSGTWYMFGGDVNTECLMITAGQQYLSSAWRLKHNHNQHHSNLEVYKWMLRVVKDTRGNDMNYEYFQEWKDTESCQTNEDNDYPDDLTQNPVVSIPGNNGLWKYTRSIYPDKISYGRGAFTVNFEYESRPDWALTDASGTTSLWGNSCNINYFGGFRLNKIIIKQHDKVFSAYDLEYKADSEIRSKFEVCEKNKECELNEVVKKSHSLLQKIVRYGIDYVTSPLSGEVTSARSLPPYTFTYNDGEGGGIPQCGGVTCPYQILLTKADNGYGGVVAYHYEATSPPIQLCDIKNYCPPGLDIWRLRVKSREVEDQVTNNKYEVQYEYDGGKALFEKMADEETRAFDGFEFLGYGKVLEKVTYNNNPAKIAKTGRISFYQAKQVGSCLNPDERRGKPIRAETLDQGGTLSSGNVLTWSENNYSYSFSPPACTSDLNEFRNVSTPAVYISSAISWVDGITEKTETEYDQYGNVTLQKNSGNLGDGSDDRYVVTKYAYNTDKWILNKPYLVVSSSNRNGENAMSIGKTYYDGSQKLGKPPTIGNATKVITGGVNPLSSLSNNAPEASEEDVLGIEDDESVLGLSTEAYAADPIKVYVKENNINGPNYRMNNKIVRLSKLSGVCGDSCSSSCNDPVCKDSEQFYKAVRGYAQWNRATSGASYTFNIKDLDAGWTQQGCRIRDYPNNPTCTIVVRPPSATPTQGPSPTHGASITPTPPAKPKDAKTSIISNTYDPFGNVIETTDPLGRVSKTGYDQATHTLPVSVENPSPFNWKTETRYDNSLLKPVYTADINGAVTEIRYDSFGRILKVIGPSDSEDKPTLKAEYSDGKPMKVKIGILTDKSGTDGKYNYSVSFYNGLGQKLEDKKEWEGAKVQVNYTSYNSLGQTDYTIVPFLDTSSLDQFIYDSRIKNPPDKGKTSNFYDALGRVVRVDNPDGTKVTTEYSGKETIVLDTNGQRSNRKVTQVDDFGQTVKVIEYKDNSPYFIQEYTYDHAGRLIFAKDPGGHVSTYEYNLLGKKIKEVNPDSGTTSYTYDASGNLTSKKDNKNQLIVMRYDELNRIKDRIYPDGSKVTNSYDEGDRQKGRLTAVVSPNSTTKYSYNIKGQLITEKKTIAGDPTEYNTSYTYDAANRLLTVAYPDGEKVTQTYTDSSSLPYSLISSDSTVGKLITSSVYNLMGQLTERKFGNNTVLTQNYFDATTNTPNYRLKDIIVNNSTTAQGENGEVAGFQTEQGVAGAKKIAKKSSFFDTILDFFRQKIGSYFGY